jgi:brefeldin A-resistance guanine nucleotide exchange factor 1
MQTSYELPPFLLQPRRVIAQKGSSTPKAATIASEDENVVLKLLSLSVQVLRCPAGRKYLSPHDICGIFDTCLFIFLASGDAKLSLLCSAAADALSHCVIVVFGMGAGRMNDNNHHRARDDDTVDPTTVDGSDSDDEWGERDPAADMDEGSFFIKRDRLSNSEVKSEEPKPDVIRETKPTEGGGKHEEPEPALVSILARLAVMADPLIQQSDTCALSLSLINIALETMADVDALASKYPRLLTIMQNDLCRNLLRVSTSSDLTMLGLALRVIFNLFSSIKHHMKLQLEVFLTSVHLRMLSSSKSPANHQQVWSSSPEHRELALESLLEFCREPGLMMDLYLNYDCGKLLSLGVIFF